MKKLWKWGQFETDYIFKSVVMLLTNTLQINVDKGFPNRYFYINAVQGYWNLSAFKVGGPNNMLPGTPRDRNMQPQMLYQLTQKYFRCNGVECFF